MKRDEKKINEIKIKFNISFGKLIAKLNKDLNTLKTKEQKLLQEYEINSKKMVDKFYDKLRKCGCDPVEEYEKNENRE